MDEIESAGTAVAALHLAGSILLLMQVKGMVTPAECERLIDGALLSLEQNAATLSDARGEVSAAARTVLTKLLQVPAFRASGPSAG